ncbi:Guanylate kinase [Trichinella pseudospiralis]
MPELFSCSCHAGIYCEDCFRTLRRSFRDKFERSISKRTTLKLPDDVKSPEHEGTLCTAAKYPSQRHSFSGRDEEINRKLLKKLYFKNHHIRKGKKKRKHDRGT